MPLTVRLRRFVLTGALCVVQGPRRMPGQAARKAAAKAKETKALVAQQVAVAVASKLCVNNIIELVFTLILWYL